MKILNIRITLIRFGALDLEKAADIIAEKKKLLKNSKDIEKIEREAAC